MKSPETCNYCDIRGKGGRMPREKKPRKGLGLDCGGLELLGSSDFILYIGSAVPSLFGTSDQFPGR